MQVAIARVHGTEQSAFTDGDAAESGMEITVEPDGKYMEEVTA